MKKIGVLLLVVFTAVSCSLFTKQQPDNIVARVGEQYLLKSDLRQHIPSLTSAEDSSRMAASYINDWATRELLFQGALLNISEDEQEAYDDLIRTYREDLYMKAYKDALIAKELDSTITNAEADEFYEAQKQNFNLNEPLLQLRYIHVPVDYNNLSMLKKHLISFNEEDKYALDSLSIQFKGFFLNDSTWVKRSQVQEQIPMINASNADNLLKKTNFLQLRDSLGLYLVAVKGTLSRNDTAPLEYVRPTIEQIILNKRKLALVKRLEKEIKEDAIKDKKFEVYQ
tara:strand:+ start:53335 stop:54186 length:852 start_codon:yes stop_codon:yes gene_type:complete